MTTGVQRIDGITIGEFYVLRLRNDRFRGYTGAFYSEFATVRGKLVGRQARLRIGDPYDQTVWTRVIERWQPKKHKFKGWRSRSENRLRTLSGGNIPFSNAICG